KGKGFNLAQITPGTTFMSNLKSFLHYYACTLLEKDVYSKIKIVISASDVVGEGEFKIMQAILNTKEVDATHLLVGDDSDLCLLGNLFFYNILFNYAFLYVAMLTRLPNVSVLTAQKTLFFHVNMLYD